MPDGPSPDANSANTPPKTSSNVESAEPQLFTRREALGRLFGRTRQENTPAVNEPTADRLNSSRFTDKLHNMLNRLKMSRRTFLKSSAAAAVVGTVVGTKLSDATLNSLSKTTIDQEMNVNGNRMHFSAQEFSPKTGEIKDPEELVVFMIGAPLRASASIGWEGPESLAEQCKAKAISVDARPIGDYTGNAIDLEVATILQFLETLPTGDPKHPKYKKITLVAHSVGVAKAFKLAAEIYEKNQEMQVMGVVGMNPVGFYPQESAEIFANYFADGANQPKLQNPRAVHKSPGEFGPQIIGSINKDMQDAGPAYPKLVADQIASATQISPDLNRVHAPVALYLGGEDKVIKTEQILPPAEIVKYLPQTTAKGEQMRRVLTRAKDHNWDELSAQEKDLFGSKAEFVRVQREQIAQIGYAHDAYVKDHYLPNSEQVRVIVASKFASHLAFNERRDMSSHITSRIFDWMRRNPPEKRVANPLKKAA